MGGRLVVPERWRTAWNPNAYKFEVDLKKGERTPLRIEWQPDGGVAYCGLRAATPQTEQEQGRVSIWAEMDKEMDYYFITPLGFPPTDSRTSYTPRSVFQDGSER